MCSSSRLGVHRMNEKLSVVSIVVLSHNRPQYLVQALDSITSQTYPHLEIIVVDNRSPCSPEIARIVQSYQRTTLVQNESNLGFTGGMNKGIEAASGGYIHLTVDDVLLDKDCIQHLAGYLDGHPSVGMLSGILTNEDGSIRCAGGRFDLSPIYLQTIFGAGERNLAQFSQPYPVKYIPGGMIFSRLDFMKRLKGFRPDFFIYSEDAELCARVSKLGCDIVVVPQAKATVLNAPHSFTPEGIAFHKIKNIFTLYLLHARFRVIPEFLLRYGIISFPRYLLTKRKLVWPLTRAWGWFIVNTPSLLWERFRNRSLASNRQGQ